MYLFYLIYLLENIILEISTMFQILSLPIFSFESKQNQNHPFVSGGGQRKTSNIILTESFTEVCQHAIVYDQNSP